MGHELPFELVVLHLERDVELAAGMVFSVVAAMGAAVGISGCSGAHVLEQCAGGGHLGRERED